MTPADGSAAAPSSGSTKPGLGTLLDELDWRGMLHATTPGLPARLATGRPIAGYNGFDPSGPWLHIGHLVPIMGLLQLQRHGGRPVVLVGGGTGMIGDPSGTSAERNLLDRETLATNVASIHGQLERFLDLFSFGSSRHRSEHAEIGVAGKVFVEGRRFDDGADAAQRLQRMSRHVVSE